MLTFKCMGHFSNTITFLGDLTKANEAHILIIFFLTFSECIITTKH